MMNMIKSMKTMASITALSTLLLFTSVSSAAVSEDGLVIEPPNHHHKSGHMMKRMASYLDLTDLQKSELKAIKKQGKVANKSLHDELKQFKEAQKILMQAEEFDEQAYLALHASYQPTFTQLALTKAKTKHALFNVLTTAQQQKWLQKKTQRKGHKSGHKKMTKAH